jgi:hypothetical protein
MIDVTLHKNFLPRSVIDNLYTFFEENKDLHELSNHMVKIKSPWSHCKNLLEPYLEKIINTEKNLGDNFYKHKYPYFPHVDAGNNIFSVNVLIPIKTGNSELQKFIIFDQYKADFVPATWTGNFNFEADFEYNKMSGFPSKDKTVKNLTNKEIDNVFYEMYLKDDRMRDKELFFGLSGTAYNFLPGNVLVFPSNRIHATGTMMSDWKIGLSLRFEI